MITKEDLWWLETVKVGDRLEIQPYWNESTRTGQLHGPLEVVAVRRTGRSQSGVLISVKAEGHAEPTCLDAAWFIGPYGNRKFKEEDGWWRSERNEMKRDCDLAIKEAK